MPQGKKERWKKKRDGGEAKRSRTKLRWDRQTLNGFNRRAGTRNHCFKCGSEYLLAPECPLRVNPRNASAPFAQPSNKVRRPPISPISTEAPVSAQDDRSSVRAAARISCEQSLPTASDW